MSIIGAISRQLLSMFTSTNKEKTYHENQTDPHPVADSEGVQQTSLYNSNNDCFAKYCHFYSVSLHSNVGDLPLC